jgi:hypothetical protein
MVRIATHQGNAVLVLVLMTVPPEAKAVRLQVPPLGSPVNGAEYEELGVAQSR